MASLGNQRGTSCMRAYASRPNKVFLSVIVRKIGRRTSARLSPAHSAIFDENSIRASRENQSPLANWPFYATNPAAAASTASDRSIHGPRCHLASSVGSLQQRPQPSPVSSALIAARGGVLPGAGQTPANLIYSTIISITVCR